MGGRSALQGKPIRTIPKDEAKLCELNFIARFETKMEKYPIRLHSPIDGKDYQIRGRKDWVHAILATRETPDMPGNVRSRYAKTEKRHGFFGDPVDRVVVEAVSFNHLQEYELYGFDSRRANLGDLLQIVATHTRSARVAQHFHVLGIASPTGWDERVIAEMESPEFARNNLGSHVSVCLIDSVTGDLHYSPSDERISGFTDFFRLEFDSERVAVVRQAVQQKLAVASHVVLDDVIKDTDEVEAIVLKAFHELEADGKGRVRHVRDVGIVLEEK